MCPFVTRRRFVNDELNELDFAVSHIAENFLKPETGVLAVVTHSTPELNVVNSCLSERSIEPPRAAPFVPMGEEELGQLEKRLWDVVHDRPLRLPSHEKPDNLRCADARLTLAVRTAAAKIVPTEGRVTGQGQLREEDVES